MRIRFDDLPVMARTVFGEARGEPHEGRLAVAHVILNRARSGGWWDAGVSEVCLKRWQFSCWNPGDPNRPRLFQIELDDRDLLGCARDLWRTLPEAESDPDRIELSRLTFRLIHLADILAVTTSE